MTCPLNCGSEWVVVYPTLSLIGYVHSGVGNWAAATSLNCAVLCDTGLASAEKQCPVMCNTWLGSEMSKVENRKVELLRV